MTDIVILLLAATAIFSGCKWMKWKLLTYATLAFTIENYREPASAEITYYEKSN